jgi:hypothetical protein
LACHDAIVSPTNKDNNHSMGVEAEKSVPYLWTPKWRMELVV